MKRGTVPLYQQIAARIRFQIAAHLFLPYEALPATRVAAREWGVHYHTVRKAYHELAKAGLVCSDPPGLTYVSPGVDIVTPSEGQRHLFIEKIIHDATYLYGLYPADLCKKIEEWDYRDAEVPPWPESMKLEKPTRHTSKGRQ